MNPDGNEAPYRSTPSAASATAFKAWAFALISFAISLQVLTTIEIGGGELRFGTSDLLLPVLVPLVMWKCRGRRSPRSGYPRRRRRNNQSKLYTVPRYPTRYPTPL